MTLTIALWVAAAALLAIAVLQVLCWRAVRALLREQECRRRLSENWTTAVLGDLHRELFTAIRDQRRPDTAVLYVLMTWLATEPYREYDWELLHRLYRLQAAFRDYPETVETEAQAVLERLETLLGYRRQADEDGVGGGCD